MLVACATAEEGATPFDQASPGGVTISIIDRGWHTDVALPADALSGPLAEFKQTFPGIGFAVFGFGDRDYYMAREETFLGTFSALFPGPGVILVTGLRAPPADAFEGDRVVSLRLSCRELRALGEFIARAMAIGPDGSLQRLGDGPYPGSLFYASSKTYDAFHDCNSWTIASLRSAGLPADPDGVLFAGQAMTQARSLAKLQALHPLPSSSGDTAAGC